MPQICIYLFDILKTQDFSNEVSYLFIFKSVHVSARIVFVIYVIRDNAHGSHRMCYSVPINSCAQSRRPVHTSASYCLQITCHCGINIYLAITYRVGDRISNGEFQ